MWDRMNSRLWLRASNYKNHRIFTLRCLHKDLIPVSIKLKSTLKTEKARKIISKAEKDLLQASVRAINSILDNVTKQTEECRSQLASIISAQRLRECQGFVDKVGEIRFTKVRQRQLNKYNMLLNKKEGSITRVNATNLTNSNNLASQAGRQAGRLALPFPLGKAVIHLKQAGQLSNQARSVRQGFRQSTRHRAPQAFQENNAFSQEDNLTTTTPSRLPQGSSNEEPNPKWVNNLSNKPLTSAQRSVLAKGPTFVVTPRQPPNLEYITAIEAACTKLSQQDAEELRVDINRVLRSSHPPNLT